MFFWYFPLVTFWTILYFPFILKIRLCSKEHTFWNVFLVPCSRDKKDQVPCWKNLDPTDHSIIWVSELAIGSLLFCYACIPKPLFIREKIKGKKKKKGKMEILSRHSILLLKFLSFYKEKKFSFSLREGKNYATLNTTNHTWAYRVQTSL